MYWYVHERKRPACLLGLHPLLGYYDTLTIPLGLRLTSGIRTMLSRLLAPTACHNDNRRDRGHDDMPESSRADQFRQCRLDNVIRRRPDFLSKDKYLSYIYIQQSFLHGFSPIITSPFILHAMLHLFSTFNISVFKMLHSFSIM